MQELWNFAAKALDHNRISSAQGPLTVAGGHQFRSLWVRDFCFSVPGLLALGYSEQVKKQLELCLKYQREDGLIARGFDVINPKVRVLSESLDLTGLLKNAVRKLDYRKRPLMIEYLGEHRTYAADSNLLVILACLQWTDKTGDDFFWFRYNPSLAKAFQFSRQNSQDGLLVQPAFSDWQDSARREGSRFYLNLLFYRILRRLQEKQISWAFSEDVEDWQNKLWNHFFSPDVGLFRDEAKSGDEIFSLECQLWCIEEDLFADKISRQDLWNHLKNSKLWQPLPGKPVWPHYKAKDISWTTKFVGLRHYHDDFHWSWLMGESLKVARLMTDEPEAEKIKAELTRLASKYKDVYEVYEGTELKPVSRLLYKSERPFSWGAAKIIEALSYGNPRQF